MEAGMMKHKRKRDSKYMQAFIIDAFWDGERHRNIIMFI